MAFPSGKWNVYGSSISAAAVRPEERPMPPNPGYPVSIASIAEIASIPTAKKSCGRPWNVSAASSLSPQYIFKNAR